MSQPTIGLALAGGGPAGAVYEIGALRALDEAISGLDLTDLPVYVGVSAGALINACLANGIDSATLCRLVVQADVDDDPLAPDTFQKLDLGAFAERLLSVPRLLGNSVASYFGSPSRPGIVKAFARGLAEALPVGLFRNAPIQRFLERTFSKAKRTDRFDELDANLFVIATDLETGQAVRFGKDSHADVPISKAVQASSALPGLYPPVEIDGRHYVDGVLIKTMHASIALDEGCDLVLCINPIVPVDTSDLVATGRLDSGQLVDMGMPTVLSQTFRTLIHSRLQLGMAGYADRYPDADVVLFEPPRQHAHMFFTNVFGFSERRRICEYAFLATLATLKERAKELRPMLAAHGLRLNEAAFTLKASDLWKRSGAPIGRAGSTTARRLRRTLASLDKALDDV
ncbi:MAG: patatin-like phospholipase family protein [Bacteroidota bacterium]